MARKKKPGLRRVEKTGPAFPITAKLTMKAFAGPTNKPYYGFSVSKLNKFEYPVFRAKFAARKYLDLLIKDDDYEWEVDKWDRDVIVTECGLKISGPNIEELMDYEYKSKKVKAWELPDDYVGRAAHMRSDVKNPKFVRVERQKRISRRGMILMKDIAKEIGMHPRDARGILRALDYEKPEHGWAWKTKEEADEIKQTLQQSRRKMQSTDD
jgi:hypothetical protein